MNTDFKIGDNVYLVNGINCFNVEFNKTYTVIDVKNSIKGHQVIAFEENIYESGQFLYLDSRRFKKDIKHTRKKKLSKLFNNDY